MEKLTRSTPASAALHLVGPVFAVGGHAHAKARMPGDPCKLGQSGVQCRFTAGQVEFANAQGVAQRCQCVPVVVIGKHRRGQEPGAVGGRIDRHPPRTAQRHERFRSTGQVVGYDRGALVVAERASQPTRVDDLHPQGAVHINGDWQFDSR